MSFQAGSCPDRLEAFCCPGQGAASWLAGEAAPAMVFIDGVHRLAGQLYAGHFCCRVKTGTGFHGVQVVMPHDECTGESCPQFAEQCQQGGFLLQGPGVCGDAFAREAAFVAHADAVRVVVLAMRACLFQGASAVYFAVARDVEMIAYVREAAVADVVRAAGFEIQAPPLGGGGAVDDDEGDGSHGAYMQAFRPKAPAMALATVMITFRISVQVVFFVFESILFFVFCGLIMRFVFCFTTDCTDFHRLIPLGIRGLN